MFKADLHCHSLYSDGSLEPGEILAQAIRHQVTLLALTDHDTLAGQALLLDALKQYRSQPQAGVSLASIQAVTGVEISCHWQGRDIHLVGLDFDLKDENLSELLSLQQRKRRERAERLSTKLELRLGIADALNKLERLARGGVICRSHAAQLLVDEGKVPDRRRAFERFLAKGKLAAVSSDWCSLEQAIGVLKNAHGLSVLAHPDRYRLSNSRQHELISDAKHWGLDALELVYPGLTAHTQRRLSRLAHSLELKGSAGSDFHHPHQVWALPKKVAALPVDIVPVWDCFNLS